MLVLPRAVYVHISQTDNTKPIPIMKGCTHSLTRYFSSAVEILIVEGMIFCHRHFNSITVYRCRRRIDKLLYFMLYASLKYIECSGNIYIERCARKVLAMQ